MSGLPWHIGTETDEDDDVYLDRASSVCSCAIDKLSLAGGFLSKVFDDYEEDAEASSHTGRCHCLPLLAGGFGDAS